MSPRSAPYIFSPPSHAENTSTSFSFFVTRTPHIRFYSAKQVYYSTFGLFQQIISAAVYNKTDSILRYLLSSEKAVPHDRKTSGGGGIAKSWWEMLDLNQRSLSATDLQSAPFDQTLAFSLIWWSSPIKIRTQRRLDLFKRDRLRPMLIVVGQDQFIIEHIHGVYKCINQAFLKITVCWIAMTELLKPCRHLFAGQLWLFAVQRSGYSQGFLLFVLPAHQAAVWWTA